MERHVHVIARDGKRLATYPISIGTEEAERREAEVLRGGPAPCPRRESRRAREAEAAALRFEFATGPRAMAVAEGPAMVAYSGQRSSGRQKLSLGVSHVSVG